MELADELLRRTDPRGYYVIPVRHGGRSEEAARIASEYGALVEEVGDIVLVFVKSRSTAKKLLEKLLSSGFSIA